MTIERATDVRSASGAAEIGFADPLCVWAEVGPLRGRELFSADQTQAEIDTRIAIRWSPKTDRIRAKDRVTHRGVHYNIQSVINVDMAYDEVQLMCKSGRNEG